MMGNNSPPPPRMQTTTIEELSGMPSSMSGGMQNGRFEDLNRSPVKLLINYKNSLYITKVYSYI